MLIILRVKIDKVSKHFISLIPPKNLNYKQPMVNNHQPLNQYSNLNDTELEFSNQNLVGSLIIQDCPNLTSIKCGNNSNLTEVKLINLPNLTYFHANGCQIKELEVTDCSSISEFNVANNLLTETNFFNDLNLDKLTHLSIHSNNFSEQDLSFLSQFTKLENLFIDNNDQKKFDSGIYNRFAGSLEPLRDLENLGYLNIANTDIDSGLEFLPDNVKKIGLVNNWERKNTGCLDLKWELERSARLPEVTEKLQKSEKDEPPFVKNWYRLAPWNQAWEKTKGEAFKKYKAQDWLNEKYPSHTNRQHYRELIIDDKNLEEELDLSNFTNLEKLNCSYNLLTNLNLTKCQNLTELDCSNNKFTNLDFLKQIPNPEKLERLNLSNNQEISGDLSFLSPFLGLKQLDISNCSLFGSFKPLKKLNNLKIINISHTDVNSGLDYLSDNCCELYCESNERKKSSGIANILTKYFEPKGKYYNLVKWREELRNNIISSIPTERLFVIRSNIKKFVDKWSKEPKQKKWLKKFFAEQILHQTQPINKLDELQSPEQFKKYQHSSYFQYGSYVTTTAGGVLTLLGKINNQGELTTAGGIMSLLSPVVSIIATKFKESFYNDKKEQWSEFTQDCNELLDNYHELLGILESLRDYKVGVLDQTLKSLGDKSEGFLQKYDEDKNGTVDIYELQEKKDILAQDLGNKRTAKNNQLGEIYQTIKKLEEEINKYQRGFYYGRKEEDERENNISETINHEQQNSTDDIVNSLGIIETTNHETQYHTAIELQPLIH
ncbi:MAG: hypothetical protein GBAus27B_000589 [Mycoplasmataceae bacterium]|nr:MAG: hypothetical protein GBAus27B_000589 [Mycoplasmataceae bacterium]